MTKVSAPCSWCGVVETTSRAIDLRLCSNRRELSSYSFDCPSCGRRNERGASDLIIRLLVNAGVGMTSWAVPAEALEDHVGPPITFDDVLDFHFALRDA